MTTITTDSKVLTKEKFSRVLEMYYPDMMRKGISLQRIEKIFTDGGTFSKKEKDEAWKVFEKGRGQAFDAYIKQFI